jgi:hypothetical protein
MKQLLLISALFLAACDSVITKDDIDVAEYVCAATGEELYSIGHNTFGDLKFKCGGIEGAYQNIKEAIQREGMACILEVSND